MQLVKPPVDFVEKFEEHALPKWRLIRTLTDKNTNLRAQRDLLLPKLISGEIDVSDIAEPMVRAR